MTDPTPSVIAGALSEEERAELLLYNPEWHLHFKAAQIVVVGRLGGLGLLSLTDEYNGPMAMLTDLGREVAAELQKRG